MTGSADLMASRCAEGLLPSSLATGRPPAWGLNSVSAVGSHSLASLITQVHWDQGSLCHSMSANKQLVLSWGLSAVSWVLICTVGFDSNSCSTYVLYMTSTSLSWRMLDLALLWSVAFIPYLSCPARLG